MSQYTIYYDNVQNRLFLKKDNDISIPGPAEELNNQLSNFYENNRVNNNQNNNPNNLVEINSSQFFEKFKSLRGPKGDKGEQGIQGLRGHPGVCNCNSALLMEKIDTLEKRIIELEKERIKNNNTISNNPNNTYNTISNNPNTSNFNNINPNNNNPNTLNFNNNNPNNNDKISLLERKIDELINHNLISNKLLQNNKYNIGFKVIPIAGVDEIQLTIKNNIYDSIYLGIDNQIKSNNDIKIAKFINNTDINDIQYFPLINNNNNVNIRLNYNKSLNVVKITDIKSDIEKIEATIYNINSIIKKTVSLHLFFEIHSINQSNNINHSIYPYYNNKYDIKSPNNTCITSVKRVRLSDEIDDIEIPLFKDDYQNYGNLYLFVRLGLTKRSEEDLLGIDIHNNPTYGYIALKEFNLSFNCYVG